jgi:hypothetical protein
MERFLLIIPQSKKMILTEIQSNCLNILINKTKQKNHSLFMRLVSVHYFYSYMSNEEIEHWNTFIEKLDNKMNEIRFLIAKRYMVFHPLILLR